MQKGEQTTAYTYDGMGRLLTETEGDTATAYTYTPFGNRATKTVTADGVTTQTITYAYDKNNRLTKEQSTQDGQTVVTGYTYDHNGNMLLKNAIALSSEGTGAVWMIFINETNKPRHTQFCFGLFFYKFYFDIMIS